jgi:VWFA-related protein
MNRKAAACVIAVLLASATLLAQQTFKSSIDLVRVDVLATNFGRPVPGLTANDFELFDNGVLQKPELVRDAGGVTVLPLLDTSASVAGDRLRDLLTAARALLRGLQPGDTAGLLTFHEGLTMVVPLAPVNPRAADITSALNRVQASGSTALYDALFAGMTLAANDSGRSLLLLFSDGADTASWVKRQAVEEAARRLNVVVYVVFTGADIPVPLAGPAVGRVFLQKIADTTGGQMFNAQSHDLESQFAKILAEFRQRVVLAYEPQGVPRDDGWHTLKVKLKSKPGDVKTRSGYFANSRRP